MQAVSHPQVREGGFYPQALEKGLRSERALTLALAEMYVQGVSTRKVQAITEQLCGVNISSSLVSQAAAQLDEELAKWRERPLGEYPYLFLDAYYEQVREDGQVRHLAVLVAVGVNPEGKREILGVSVSLSEHEVHWRAFLQSLKQRGLGGLQLVTSDDHAGLRAARLAVFGGISSSLMKTTQHIYSASHMRSYRRSIESFNLKILKVIPKCGS